MAKDRRPLSDEETALWNRVAGTAVPLRGNQRLPIGSVKKQTPHPTPIISRTPRDAPRQAVPPARGLGQIDRRTVRRIARGSIGLDARLDLHGLTQTIAHARLTEFVSEAQQDGLRTVLIITGKGAG
ncbi:MAG: Smr/MutS family protein, partial [Alphaproteobacteria bacterium]